MKVRVTSVNRTGTVFCSETRGHQFLCDVPSPMGGTDTAMTPVEAVLAALGNCMGTVIALACRNKGIPYEGLSVQVEAELIEAEHRLDNFRMTVNMPGPVDDMTRRTIDASGAMCNVHNTLERRAHVECVIAE